MKSVMLSIQPKWCELIAEGKKTVEVRKTKPNINTPFKCFIYCTKPKKMFRMSTVLYTYSDNLIRNEVDGSFTVGDGFDFWANGTPHTYLNGYVIGEFVCEKIDFHSAVAFCIKEDADKSISGSCLSYEEIKKYLGWKSGEKRYYCNPFYCWHISNLVIYDKPKELSEFGLKRPFQSWGYVTDDTQTSR